MDATVDMGHKWARGNGRGCRFLTALQRTTRSRVYVAEFRGFVACSIGPNVHQQRSPSQARSKLGATVCGISLQYLRTFAIPVSDAFNTCSTAPDMSSHKIASTQRFSAMEISLAPAEYAILAEETENDFHGPMPITEFFDAFMKTEDDKKPPKRATQIFKNMPRVGNFENVFVSIFSFVLSD